MTHLGDYGINGGTTVIEVQTVPGHVREIRQLWRDLDDAGGGPDEPGIVRRLRQIGAIRNEGQPE